MNRVACHCLHSVKGQFVEANGVRCFQDADTEPLKIALTDGWFHLTLLTGQLVGLEWVLIREIADG